MHAPRFWQSRGAASQLLAPLGMVYGASIALKFRRAHCFHCGIPVICVGNLTAGGSGKTPIAIAIAKFLQTVNLRPYFLTRGYGGREKGPRLVNDHDKAQQVGDEALLLADTAPTILARDRAKGAALCRQKGAQLIVMDDGHQNFSLHKDLSLVVVDAHSGFGNGRMIPAGPLREPVEQGLSRADAVIVIGDGATDFAQFSGPVLRARIVAEEKGLAGEPVYGFAGIGRPEKFRASLEAGGAVVRGFRGFPDHHFYSRSEIAQLRKAAGNAMLVTTEKDYVRLGRAEREGIAVLRVAAIFEDPSALRSLLDRVIELV